MFAAAVAWAAKSASGHSAMPILAGVRLEASEGDQLTLSAFDYDVSSKGNLKVAVAVPGVCLVSAVTLSAVLKSFDGPEVEVTVDGSYAAIRCGDDDFKLRLLPVGDYPALPPLGDPVGEVNGDDLARAVRQVCYAVAHPGKAALRFTGVMFELADKLTIAATNLYQFPVTEIPWVPATGDVPAPVVVPPAILTAFASVAKGRKVEVSFSRRTDGKPGMIGLSCGGTAMTARLIQDEWPDWRAIVPDVQGPTVATVDVDALTVALDRAGVVSSSQNATVDLAFSADGVTVTGGEESRYQRTVSAQFEGEEQMKRVNLGYLSRALKHLGSDVARFSLHKRQVLVTPVADVVDHRHVIVPVTVK